MKPKNYSRLRAAFPAFILAGSIAASFIAPTAEAVDRTWSGATNTWNTNTNWVDDVLPVNNDSLIFGAAGAGGVLLNNDRPPFNVAALTFAADAPAYVIGDGTTTANAGNSITLNGNLANNSGHTQTLNTPIALNATRIITANGGDINLAGNITGAAGGIQSGGFSTVILSGTNSYGNITRA